MFPMIAVAMLILLVFIGVYFYHLFRRALHEFGLDHNKIIARTISVILAVLMIIWASNIRGSGLVAAMYLIVYGLILDIINLVLKRIFKNKILSVWKVLHRGGILLVVLTSVTIAYGYYNMGNVIETRYEIISDKLDQGESLKIAMISDLHLGMNMHADGLAVHLEKIQAEEPDMFLLVGDLFDEGTTREDMLKAAELLGDVKTTYGVFYVYGNHDVNQYSSEKAYTPEEMTAALKNAGIQILADSSVTLENGVSIIGRLDRSFGVRSEVAELVADLPKDDLKLLLDHQPADMKDKADAGIDLQVSGHTHAGQVWPFGQFSELTGFNEMNYGLREYGDMTAIVSSGIAGWGFPIRTAEHCEYVMIEIVGE